jgi:hypothetical protein
MIFNVGLVAAVVILDTGNLSGIDQTVSLIVEE